MPLISSTFKIRLQLSGAPQLPASMRFLTTTCLYCIQCLSSVKEHSNICVYAVLCSEVFFFFFFQFCTHGYPCSNYFIQLPEMQVAKILGKERTASYLKESFYSLLKDSALIVQSKLFNILPTIIGLMLAMLAETCIFCSSLKLDSQKFSCVGFHQVTSVCRMRSQKPQPTQP